jgi:hypothetical protein
MSTYKDYNHEKQRLKDKIEEYKTNTIKHRIEMIKIKKTFKRIGPDSHMIGNAVNTYLNELIRDVDKIQGPLWNEKKLNEVRALWDKQQGTKHNYEYIDVVRIVYEKFFDDVINLIK